MRPPTDAQIELLDYYSALTSLRGDLRGASVLHAPGSPIVGANAAYLTSEEGLLRADVWYRAQEAPAVIGSPSQVENGKEVLRLRIGTYRPQALNSEVSDLGAVVEQVSRLQLAAFADALAAGWNLPEWGASLNRSLARVLEQRRDFTLLMAYREKPIGALLLLPSGAHLWGVTNPNALESLLNTAAELSGGAVRTSLTPEIDLPLTDEEPFSYWFISA